MSSSQLFHCDNFLLRPFLSRLLRRRSFRSALFSPAFPGRLANSGAALSAHPPLTPALLSRQSSDLLYSLFSTSVNLTQRLKRPINRCALTLKLRDDTLYRLLSYANLEIELSRRASLRRRDVPQQYWPFRAYPRCRSVDQDEQAVEVGIFGSLRTYTDPNSRMENLG